MKGCEGSKIRRWLNAILRLLASAALLGVQAVGSACAAQDLIVSTPALDSVLTVRASRQFAGAISSVTFRGVEYIDSRGPGALLQSASSFDALGECYNPTEAGSWKGDGVSHTSLLLAGRVVENRIVTVTNMGFWRNPGQHYGRHCGGRADFGDIANTTLTSGHILKQEVVVGLPAYTNVINYLATFQVPKPANYLPGSVRDRGEFASGLFEAPTGYLVAAFSAAERFNPKTGVAKPIVAHFNAGRPGFYQEERNWPVILFTPDRAHAMGVWSPLLPQGGTPNVGYEYGRFEAPYSRPANFKWGCDFRAPKGAVPAGDYSFGCYIIVGTVAEVEETMVRLAHDPKFNNRP